MADARRRVAPTRWSVGLHRCHRSWDLLARKFHDNAVRSLPKERAVEIAARTLALPDAQSVEDLTALLTSAGEL